MRKIRLKKQIPLITAIVLLVPLLVFGTINFQLNSPQNNTYSDTSQVDFTFTITGNVSTYNCSIFTNRTGMWAINATNATVINNTLSNFSLQNFNDGEVIWGLMCQIDSEINYAENRSLFIDTAAPGWSNNLTVPATNKSYNNSLLYWFNTTWTDNNLNLVWIEHNFTGILANYSVTGNESSTVFFYTSPLAAGDYAWRMYANDSAGNSNATPLFHYRVRKAIPVLNLTFNQSQGNLSINQTWGLNITGIIVDGEASYVELYRNGSIINNGSSPVSNLSVFADPGLFNLTLIHPSTQNYSSFSLSFFIEVNDTFVPGISNVTNVSSNATQYQISWNTTEPANSIVFYGNESGAYQWNVSNLTRYVLVHNLTLAGLETNTTYFYVVNSTDKSGKSNQTAEYNFTTPFVDKEAPTWSAQLAIPSSGSNYNQSENYQFSINWTDNINLSSVWIEHNFSGQTQNYSVTGNLSNMLFYLNVSKIAAGSYTWRTYANDTSNNLAVSDQFNYLVNKALPQLNLTINATAGNISINQTWELNITGSVVEGEGNNYIELYRNGALINNGSSPLSNLTIFNYPGWYNISIVYGPTQNYSKGMVTYWVEVNDTCNPPADGDWNIENGSLIICFGKDTLLNNNISVNGTLLLVNSSFNFNKSITIRRGGALALENTFLELGKPVTLYDNTSFHVRHSGLNFSKITLNNQSLLNITNSDAINLTGAADIDAFGNASLIMENASFLNSSYSIDFFFYNSTNLNISNLSTGSGNLQIFFYGNSTGTIRNFNLNGSYAKDTLPSRGVASHENSSLSIVNSWFNLIVMKGQAQKLYDAKVGTLEIGPRENEELYIENFRNISLVDYYNLSYNGREINISKTNISAFDVSYSDNANVTIFNSTFSLADFGCRNCFNTLDSVIIAQAKLEKNSYNRFTRVNITFVSLLDNTTVNISDIAKFQSLSVKGDDKGTIVLSGNLTISTKSLSFAQNMSLNRYFPIYVYYQNGSAADQAEVNITYLNQSITSGSTKEGYLVLNLTFNASTYTKEYNITIDNYTRANLTMLSDTPLNITYDVTAPLITLQSPENESFSLLNAVSLNITTDDLSMCVYGLNNQSASNITTTPTLSHLISLTSLSEGTYNLSINCTNSFALSSAIISNFTIDMTKPSVIFSYPQQNQHIHSLNPWFNFSIYDIFLDQVWYTLDWNSTIYPLNPSSPNLTTSENIAFRYPGKHLITLYANDSSGNLKTRQLQFYSNVSLNITAWMGDFLTISPDVQQLIVQNRTGDAQTQNISIYSNLTLLFNLTGIQVKIVNVSALYSIWDTLFILEENPLSYSQEVISGQGTKPQDLVVVKNFSYFNNESTSYYGKVTLPLNRSNYTNIYYCDSNACQRVTSTCSSYTKGSSDPCYQELANGTLVYVPHFSAVFGDNDSIAPNISIASPLNNSLLQDSYYNNLTFSTNELASCAYRLNSSSAWTAYAQQAKTFQTFFPEVWADGIYTMTISCNDTNTNNNNAISSFEVNDTTPPKITSLTLTRTSGETDIKLVTDEPTLCKYNESSNLSFNSMITLESGYKLSHSKTVTSEGNYYFRCQDAKANEAQGFKVVTIDTNQNDGSSPSGNQDDEKGPPSSAPKKLSTVWPELSAGEHTMYVSSSAIPITKLIFDLPTSINKSVRLSVESTDLPGNLPDLDGLVFGYLKITATNLEDSDISKVEILFRVTNTWIDEENINRDTVQLYRLAGTWQALSTSLTDTDSTYTYYKAQSPGFSYYSISGMEDKTPQSSSTTAPSTPPEQNNSELEPPITGQVARQNTSAVETKRSEKKGFTPANFILPVLILIIIGIIMSFLIYQNRYSVVSDKDLVELRTYVQTCEEQGIPFEKIKQNLLEVGWKESVVDLVLHDVHLPHDELEKLVKYIRYTLKNGMSKNQITENLKKVGWQEEVIMDAFSYME